MKSNEVFGFNYHGSWASSALGLWQGHDNGTMAVEIARGKQYFPGWNMCRWWLSQEAYQQNPERFLANFESGLGILASHEIRVIPVLFNRWRDPVCDLGGVTLDHVVGGMSWWSRPADLFSTDPDRGRELEPVEELFATFLGDVVGTHATDERIYAWDLCNEPFQGPYVHDEESVVRAGELAWLGWVRRTVKNFGATQLITIGNYMEPAAVRLTAPLSDIISIHAYWTWNLTEKRPGGGKEAYEEFLDEMVEVARKVGKDLIATETVWGALDDAKRVEVLRYELSQLSKRDIGFTVHALHHSLVADLHRPGYGPIGPAEALHFIEADGTLRHGHGAFNEFRPASPARLSS